jgi:hypothetical protein
MSVEFSRCIVVRGYRKRLGSDLYCIVVDYCKPVVAVTVDDMKCKRNMMSESVK